MPPGTFCQALAQRPSLNAKYALVPSIQAVARHPAQPAPVDGFSSVLSECGDTAANHLSCTKCPLGWTSGNESASCVIDDATKQPLIRFTGLRVVAEENVPTMTMEWEYTPGEALQSEPLQLRVH